LDGNRVESLVQELQSLEDQGGFSVVTGGAADWYEVLLFPPATEGQIHAAQAAAGRPLPPDFLRFWRLSNGANLFLNDSGLHGVGITSTERLRELQQDEEDYYGRAAMRPYTVFARVNGGGDFLVFELETGRVLDGVHAEQPSEWRPIAESFTDWLSHLVAAQGRYYWLEALYAAGREA
jgi:hypothetical protein